jgi:limonene-1,2-epoxide hydrolase
MSPWETIDQFRAAWDDGDLDRVCALVTDDIFYHNMPRPSMQGKDVFRAYMDGYEQRLGKFLSVHWEILKRAESGNTVFIERISHLTFANGQRIDCPIVGVFEVRDGKIASWKDYFDKSQFDK